MILVRTVRRRREPGVPSSAKTSSPRRATSLGRLRLPPIPRDGGALAAPLRGDGSRGGVALRFGARYGSSDSLRKAAPARGAYPRVGMGRRKASSARGLGGPRA